MPKNANTIPTPKQRKFIKGYMENLGIDGLTKPLRELALEAGYRPAVAKNPQYITQSAGVKNELQKLVELMESKRTLAINAIDKSKTQKASALSNAYTSDILTKQIQLLTGKRTGLEPINVNIVRYSEDVTPIKQVEPNEMP